MAQYLKVVQKLAKENGISISSSRIRELSKAIDKMDADNIEEVTGKFSKFAEKLSSGVDRAIDNLDVSIDELREDMASL
jgi:hypothetical protein